MAGALVALVTGCAAEVRVRGVAQVDDQEPVVEVQAPPHIELYPRFVYRGADVYLVDGRWYTRRNGRWVTFREEPQELARRRTGYPARTDYGYPR